MRIIRFVLFVSLACVMAPAFNRGGYSNPEFEFEDEADRFFFAASNFNRGALMAVFSGNPVKFITAIPTAVGSHAVAYDETDLGSDPVEIVLGPAVDEGWKR